MADGTVWARWYTSPSPGERSAGVTQIAHQQKCASGKEAAIYIMEKVAELDRASAQIVFPDGTSFGIEDVRRIYKAHKSAGR